MARGEGPDPRSAGRVLQYKCGSICSPWQISPVPVGQEALIVALVPESPLKRPDIVPMPQKERAAEVDGPGLIDMDSHEVIIAGLCPRREAWGDFGRCCHKTFYCEFHSILHSTKVWTVVVDG